MKEVKIGFKNLKMLQQEVSVWCNFPYLCQFESIQVDVSPFFVNLNQTCLVCKEIQEQFAAHTSTSQACVQKHKLLAVWIKVWKQ